MLALLSLFKNINWLKVVPYAILISICVFLQLKNMSKDIIIETQKTEIFKLKKEIEELQGTFDTLNNEIKIREASIKSIENKLNDYKESVKNLTNIYEKRIKAVRETKTIDKEPLIKKGEIIDDKTSNLYIDIISNNIFN